jgi:hypothetical protein
MLCYGDRKCKSSELCACVCVCLYISSFYRLSNKASLEDPRVGQDLGTLKDGTPAFKNFTDCRSNRFLTPESAGRNRLNSPSDRIYLFNCPVDFDEGQFIKVRISCHFVTF